VCSAVILHEKRGKGLEREFEDAVSNGNTVFLPTQFIIAVMLALIMVRPMKLFCL
jgi:hypothetical protein